MSEKRYIHRNLDDISALRHPYGKVFELSTGKDYPSINMAIIEMTDDIRHHHVKAVELYFVLEGHGKMAIDSDEIELKPGSFVLLKPGVSHRATAKPGEKLKILASSSPAYNPEDQFSD